MTTRIDPHDPVPCVHGGHGLRHIDLIDLAQNLADDEVVDRYLDACDSCEELSEAMYRVTEAIWRFRT